jgi:hypothetical protein
LLGATRLPVPAGSGQQQRRKWDQGWFSLENRQKVGDPAKNFPLHASKFVHISIMVETRNSRKTVAVVRPNK